MRVEPVEIYSDQTNAAVMRHPERRFPGFLVQGDILYGLCLQADEVCTTIGRDMPGFDSANQLRNWFWSALTHYRSTLDEHRIALPFSEQATSR